MQVDKVLEKLSNDIYKCDICNMQSGENFSIWLVGDTGAVQTDGQDPVMKLLHNSITGHQNGIIVFLGDLIYPEGLPEIGHLGREQAEKIMRSQLAAVEAFPGKLYFLSGNHDWKKGSAGGWKYARRLAHFIHESLGRKDVCMPILAGPGPELIEPYPGLFLIFLNTQWWMQPGEIKDERGKVFFREFRKMLSTLPPDKTLIMGHHPVRSHSLHGGKFKKRHHLFPLKLYGYRQGPPIPILGSLLVWYRKFIGAREDMASPKYAWFKAQMLDMLEDYPGITYVSGHEHNLQWIQDEGINHIISGAGSKAYYVKSGKGTRFASKSKGFIELIWQDDGVAGFRAHECNQDGTSKVTEMHWKQE